VAHALATHRARVTSTPHLSHTTRRTSCALYLPHAHRSPFVGPKMRAQKRPSALRLEGPVVDVSGFFTSPCEPARIFCRRGQLDAIASNVMASHADRGCPQVLGRLVSLIRLPKRPIRHIRILLSFLAIFVTSSTSSARDWSSFTSTLNAPACRGSEFSPLTMARRCVASSRRPTSREQSLQRVAAPSPRAPHLHLAERLAPELRLAPSGCWVTSEYGRSSGLHLVVDRCAS